MNFDELVKNFETAPQKKVEKKSNINPLRTALEKNDAAAVDHLCTELGSNIFSPPNLKMIVANFTPEIWGVLQKHKFKATSFLDDGDDVYGSPNAAFWQLWWTVAPATQLQEEWYGRCSNILSPSSFEFFAQGVSHLKFVKLASRLENPFLTFVTGDEQNKLSSEQWDTIAAMPEELWKTTDSGWMVNVRQWSEVCNAKEFERLLTFLDRVPPAQKVLQEYHKEITGAQQWLKNQCHGAVLEQLPIFQNVSTSQKKKVIHRIQSDVENSVGGQSLFEKMGMNAGEQMFFMFEQYLDCFEDYVSEKFFEKATHALASSSLFNEVVRGGWGMLRHLPASTTIGQQLCKQLNDPMVLLKFVEEDFSNLDKIINRFPQVLEWRDGNNNSLGHWKTLWEQWFGETNKNSVDFLIKHPQLREENNVGVRPANLFVDDIDPVLRARYEKAVMESSLDESALKKLRSRTKTHRKI